MVAGVNASRHLLYSVIANNNCHMFKRKGIRKVFSTDPLNPKGIQNLRFTGLTNKRAATVQPLPNNKGVQLVYVKTGRVAPSKALTIVPQRKGARKTFKSIKKFFNRSGYRKDLKMTCVRRASALLLAQRVKKVKKSKKE